MKRLRLLTVNETFKLKELSPNAQRFILEVLKEKTSDRLSTAHVNGWFTKNLWRGNPELGVRIVRDYGLQVELAYPAYHKDYPDISDVGYTIVNLGRFHKDTKKIDTDNYYRYIPCVDRFSDEELDKIFDEFSSKLNGNYKIAEDYDAQQIEDALECGDLDTILEVVGDRDLAEFI